MSDVDDIKMAQVEAGEDAVIERLRVKGLMPSATSPVTDYVAQEDTTRDHTCEICESDEYKQAEAIIQRSGLQREKWGFLLHDITRGLRGERFFVEDAERLERRRALMPDYDKKLEDWLS